MSVSSQILRQVKSNSEYLMLEAPMLPEYMTTKGENSPSSSGGNLGGDDAHGFYALDVLQFLNEVETILAHARCMGADQGLPVRKSDPDSEDGDHLLLGF